MGIEKKTVSARLDFENDLMLEGMCQNEFPGVTKSAMINMCITFIRLSRMTRDIQLNAGTWQALHRKYSNECIHGLPEIKPEKAPGLWDAKAEEKLA